MWEAQVLSYQCITLPYVYIVEYDEPHALLVLAEEELVAVDLDTEKWPCFQLPYASSLHSSAITCSQHISNVPDQLWTKLADVGAAQMTGFSKRVRLKSLLERK